MRLRVPANPGMKKAKIVIFVCLNLLLNVTMHICVYTYLKLMPVAKGQSSAFCRSTFYQDTALGQLQKQLQGLLYFIFLM